MHIDEQYDVRDASKQSEDKDRRVIIEIKDGEVQRVYAKTAAWLKVTVINLDTEEAEKIDTVPLDTLPRRFRPKKHMYYYRYSDSERIEGIAFGNNEREARANARRVMKSLIWRNLPKGLVFRKTSKEELEQLLQEGKFRAQ